MGYLQIGVCWRLTTPRARPRSRTFVGTAQAGPARSVHAPHASLLARTTRREHRTPNSLASVDALTFTSTIDLTRILSCAKAGLRVAILAAPISNRALQAYTTEPRFSVERELHPTVTPQEYKPMIPTSSAPGCKPALTNPELAEPRGFSFLALICVSGWTSHHSRTRIRSINSS